VVFVSAATLLLFVAIRRVPPVWVLVLLVRTLSATLLATMLTATLVTTLLLVGVALVLPLVSLILPLARVALVLCHFLILPFVVTERKPTRSAMRSGKDTSYF